MQAFKKIGSFIVALLLAGCVSHMPLHGPADTESDALENAGFHQGGFRVGVLLPLTGSAEKYGQGLKNAALMAMEDINNPNLILQFYDTKGTAAGARVAAENALRNRSQMIIGPLMSSSVRAIAPRMAEANTPAVAFSTAEEVLQKNIYTLGLLIDEQVDKIISYAVSRGRRNFALLIPDNATGIAVAKAAVRATLEQGVNISHIAFYPPNTTDFSGVLKELSNYEERSGKLKKIKDILSKRAAAGDADAIRDLKKAEKIDSVGDVDFDAILIPESGAKLKSAIAMLGYYDVGAPKVKILGTSVWENTVLNGEAMAIGSWYPAISRSYSAYFVKRYQELFGEKPNSLYSLAYDAVALANAVSRKPEQDIFEVITNGDGYIGINGAFRILANGHNQHSLDIVEVRRQDDAVVDPGVKTFSGVRGKSLSTDIFLPTDYVMPVIYGKDTPVAQQLIYGEDVNERELLPPSEEEIGDAQEFWEIENVGEGLEEFMEGVGSVIR